MNENSPAFQRWGSSSSGSSPEGTAESPVRWPSLWDLCPKLRRPYPALKTLGYCRLSLRDIHPQRSENPSGIARDGRSGLLQQVLVWSFPQLGIDDNGPRPVIGQRDQHVSAKAAGLDRPLQVPRKPGNEFLVERHGDFRAGGAAVGGTVSFL